MISLALLVVMFFVGSDPAGANTVGVSGPTMGPFVRKGGQKLHFVDGELYGLVVPNRYSDLQYSTYQSP